MALRDMIPGVGSAETGASSGEAQIHRMYLADEAPRETELSDYRIMIGPDIEGDDEWCVYRCTEDGTSIPENTQLYVFKTGNVVSFGGKPFQVHLAQLVQPEDVEQENYDGTFVDFPESLTGGSWPERTPISDEELQQFLVSVSSAK